ncbi:sensor domain-containing diguanylate cyclase [Niallia taxi]|uniref:sensor domain-containing diguanylate cyclase n=2 Tax=Niallia taxi TaxID=2499688 RepID=UPI00203DE55D|nr:sensor domain-containing diguanylate cyclase [Niallia taxi]MCM3213685.1 sensor domain-containing diguanylate cyclase [Niallia taxi]
MKKILKEYQFYDSFNELAIDILALAKEILPEGFLFLSAFTDKEQHILKVAENKEEIHINEGSIIPLQSAVCTRINFTEGKALVYEDISKEESLGDIKNTYQSTNVNAYLGVPVILRNGEVFGTICAVQQSATTFNSNSIKLIEKLAKMFSYYLELESMAYRDHLTGCYNRYFLERFFNQYTKKEGTIFFMDLDGFKKINDQLGHEAGDFVLKEVSLRIENVIQQSTLNGAVFRLGGDEFIVNLSNINKETIEDIANALIRNLSSWDFHIKDFRLSVSIGIVTYSREKQSLDDLLKKADNALYRAKASGKNTYRYF